MFSPKGPICQSCGMPMRRDPLGGGTEAKGARSQEYCSHCYRDGAFTQPDITADEMVLFVQRKLREMHFPAFLARYFTKNISSLRRWQGEPAARTS